MSPDKIPNKSIPTITVAISNIQKAVDDLPPQARQAVQMVMLFGGGLFIILSTYMLADPKAVKALILMNEEVTLLLAPFFLFIGLVNIIGAITIFRRKEKR